MKKVLNIISLLLLLLVSFVSLFNIFNFYNWYKRKPSDIVVDIDYFIENNFDLQQLCNFLSAIKINKIAFDAKNIKFIPQNKSFYYVIKFFSDQKYEEEQIVEFVDLNKDKIFSTIYLNADTKKTFNEIKYFHYQILKKIPFDIKLNFENHHYKIHYITHNKLPLRVFVCDLNLYKEPKIINLKIRKAFFERSCSIIYIIPSEYLSFEENLNIISQLSKNIYEKFKLYKNFTKFKSINLKIISNLSVFLFSVGFPLFFYKKELGQIFKNSILYTYLRINFLAILVGVIIWGILQNYDYLSLEKHVYGIRAMFILPLIFSFFVILDKNELIKIFHYNLRLKELIIIFLCLLLIYYLMLRMGNVSYEFVLFPEIKMREFIESFILFRPRFKEIFFTQPILYISIFLIKKTGFNLLNKIIFCFGILTFSSIINTFLHIHTPLHICVLRSVLGVGIGLALSYVYIFSFKFLKIKNFG